MRHVRMAIECCDCRSAGYNGKWACGTCGGQGEWIADEAPTAAELAAWLAERPELWAELQDAMRTATGGPLPSSDCVGGGR